VLTGDWFGSEMPRSVVGGEVRVAGRGGARGGGCCRVSPGSWIPLFDLWSSSGGATGVRGVRGSPAASNCSGVACSTAGGQGAIPAMTRSGVEGGGLGEMPGRTA
jgi:hypothetical protein